MTHFKNTQEFKNLQARLDARNMAFAQARLFIETTAASTEKSLNEAKASMMELVEKFDSRAPRIARDYVSASDIATTA